MVANNETGTSRLAHYRSWTDAWLSLEPSKLPANECMILVAKEGPQWLQEAHSTAAESIDRMHTIVACFKKAAQARLICLGGKVPPSCDECDVLSGNYDARVECTCSGLFPVPSNLDLAELRSCGCKAIERMIEVGEIVNSREDEWNSSAFFSSEGLLSAMAELALCHSDIQPTPQSCRGKHHQGDWPEVRAPDRKPSLDVDMEENVHHSLYPTQERIRLSADAKYFFAVASGGSLVDPGIQMAMVDSGNDILIADYCDAATEDHLVTLQKIGAGAFAFLKVCVEAGLLTTWQFNQLVAQTIQFRVMGYWRDHALSQRPQGVYGSRMTGMTVHRHIDLGMAVGIVSASIATGQTISAEEYNDLSDACVLISDLVDFRGDTWRNQRENVVLRGARGCLCTYLDGLLVKCIGDSAALVGRGKKFALLIMCFCNWVLMSSGHKIYEIFYGVQLVDSNPPCVYESISKCVHEELLMALEPYGTLGRDGPLITKPRKELQMLYSKHMQSSENHCKWLADAVRIVLCPGNLRRLVDVVHYSWAGELGDTNYCA